jgi:hypothetical protein
MLPRRMSVTWATAMREKFASYGPTDTRHRVRPVYITRASVVTLPVQGA